MGRSKWRGWYGSARSQLAEVSALRLKVVADGRDDVEREAARARVILRDGTAYDASVARCIGSTGRPIADEDITRKTRGQLQTVYSDSVTERIIEDAWRIANAPRVSSFCRLLGDVA